MLLQDSPGFSKILQDSSVFSRIPIFLQFQPLTHYFYPYFLGIFQDFSGFFRILLYSLLPRNFNF